jgi:hypothetical protein
MKIDKFLTGFDPEKKTSLPEQISLALLTCRPELLKPRPNDFWNTGSLSE